MRRSIVELLAEQVVLLDGAMGSALMARGLRAGACPELWNLERPEAVVEVHAEHLRAGSRVVQTNTFGASRIALARHGQADAVESINRTAVRLARDAMERPGAGGRPGDDRYVAGNIGPSGVFLPPVGKADVGELEDSFAEQAACLEAAGVDYLSIETMSDLREASCALRGARRAARLPVTVCLTYEARKRGFFTLMGDRPELACRTLVDEGAAAVGANCSVGSAALLELAPLLVEASTVPVICKPNAGLPEIQDGRPVYRQRPEDFASDAVAMARRGVRGVGGCCGTDKHFLAATARALRQLSSDGGLP